MKFVFCLDANPRFQILLLAAIRSLRSIYPRADVGVVYGGREEALLDVLLEEDVPIIRYAPYMNETNVAPGFHQAIGALLTLELALVPELSNEEYVLYFDCDVLFVKPFEELLALRPAYLAMSRQEPVPFFCEHETLDYVYKGNRYAINMPFPIWHYNSGVVLYNLGRLRKNDYIHNFLAFCLQNLEKLGNYDQPLINYYFGKRITRFDQSFNCQSFLESSKDQGRIIHFQGPKPWHLGQNYYPEQQSQNFRHFSEVWRSHLTEKERGIVHTWEMRVPPGAGLLDGGTAP